MVAHKKLLNNFDLNFLDMKAHFSVFALQKALEKAKEAGRKERALCRQREQTSLAEQINLDLTYSVSTLLDRIIFECWQSAGWIILLNSDLAQRGSYQVFGPNLHLARMFWTKNLFHAEQEALSTQWFCWVKTLDSRHMSSMQLITDRSLLMSVLLSNFNTMDWFSSSSTCGSISSLYFWLNNNFY